MEPDCICSNATMCRTKKLMYFYRSSCDVQANISVAISRIVTDKEIRVLLSQKLWRTKVAISTSVTDWLLLSLLLGRKIMYKCCHRYTVTDRSRGLRDGQLTETFYCSTYFFRNLLSTFYGFLFATLSKQGKSEGFESCDRPIVRKRPIRVKSGDVLSRVTLKFDGWLWKTIGHLSFAVSSFVQHFITISEFKLELLSRNAQFR